MNLIDPESIITATAEAYGVSAEDIMGQSRKRKVAEARHMAMMLCYDRTTLSFTDIGAAFGRTHPSAIYAKRRCAELIEVDRQTREYFKRITERL